MKYCLLIVLLFFSYVVFSQKQLTYEQVCADIDYYFAKIDSIHPNMYWDTPKSRVDSFIVALKGKYCGSMEIEQLGIELQQANCFFDYHSVVVNRTYNFYEIKNECAFPRIEIFGNRVYLQDKNNEILSINGIRVDEICQMLQNIYPLELHTDNASFEINHSLIFQRILMYMDIFPPYSVEIKQGARDSLILEPGENYWSMKAEEELFWEEFYDYDIPYSFEVCSDSSLAIIRINKCIGYNEELVKFRNFLDNCFKEIEGKQISNLFLDISRNGGGSTRACDLLLPFIQVPKKYVYRTVQQRKYWNRRGKSKLDKIINENTIVQNDEGFSGKIFIYQSPYTCSAATHLSYMLRTFDLAILVGTDTEPIVKNHRNSIYFQLPYSKLYGRVAQTFTLNQYPQKYLNSQKGLMADIPFPFLGNRHLNFSDCMKIVKLYKQFNEE